MNREIKFRAWHLDDGMLHFDFDTFKSDYHDQYGNIMQFTGLKDKNGKGNDVYAGDLFECIFSNVPNGFSPMGFDEKQIPIVSEVVFWKGMFAIKIFHPDHKEYVYSPLYKFLENEQKVVIGNIHENSDLLNE